MYCFIVHLYFILAKKYVFIMYIYIVIRKIAPFSLEKISVLVTVRKFCAINSVRDIILL